jgi:hypothetical protein
MKVRAQFIGLAIAGAMLASSGELFAAPTLASGTDPTATLSGGVRYRNFNSGGGSEVLIGLLPLATPPTADITWNAGKCVQFTYDGSVLTTRVATVATPCSFSTATVVSKTVGSLGSLNYLQLSITKNSPTTSVALNSLAVNGTSLGNLVKSGGAGTNDWNVTGADLTNGFTMTGTVAIVGLSGGGDSSFIEIKLGYVPPADDQGPITSNVAVSPSPVLLNAPATVTATVDDSTTGGNTIASADYSIDGGGSAPAAAEDGAFDEVTEDVTATFTPTQVGTHQVCVHGTDSLSNVGTASCQSYLVTYVFAGFFAPIDNTVLNGAKAGQSIPAKWRLTDGLGTPISDTASFAGLFSYPINCLDLQGDVVDSVEEYAAGDSGLQYNGDGYWQFNWKTPKSYAGTCRAMYVLLDSGATSPVVKFQFK